MGCASSKQTRCKHCHQSSYSSLPRSYSVPIHHPAQGKGDSYHVVALTSSTLGSLGSNGDFHNHLDNHTRTNNNDNCNEGMDFSREIFQAKSWSSMINEKIPKVIPKTPSRTPPGEPETINTWELMEGLDDCSPFQLPNRFDRSFSFHAVSNSTPLDQSSSVLHESKLEPEENVILSPRIDLPLMKLEENVIETAPSQPETKLQENGLELATISENETRLQENGSELPVLDEPKAKLEENGICSPSLDQPKPKLQENGNASPTHDQFKYKLQENGNRTFRPEWLQGLDPDSNVNSGPIVSDFDPEIISTFRKALKRISPVHPVYLQSPEKEKVTGPIEKQLSSKEFGDAKKVNNAAIPNKCPPYGEDKVVIYFTSLRGVRKTYEDCCHARVIMKGFGVRVDERDVSMHYGFREELKEILGVGSSGGLPKVFVQGQYIGGAEDIRQLNEDGELEKVVEGCAVMDESEGGGICELCGDVRFVPCESCSGSCKIYCEDENEWEGEDGSGGFQRCPDCNENGLVRCSRCCY